jgi:hypothetical protein
MTKIPKLKILFLLSIFYFLLSVNLVEAAELNLTSSIQEFGVGQQFQVDLILNTQNEEINAVEGRIIFSSETLELKEMRDGNSIVNFWVERPKAKFNNEIDFSGIVPGGYTGEKGLIFSIIFQSKAEGEGIVEIQNAKALLNDGEGTTAKTTISNFQFLISEKVSIPQISIPEIKDTDPPEDFKPEIAQSPEMFDGKYFLVFATQDKGSGIDHYEVCEGSKKKCVIAESPYLLQNQKLDQQIFVKAVDKSGNERVVMLPPQKPLPWYKNYAILAILIIIGLFVAGVILRKILWKRHSHLK